MQFKFKIEQYQTDAAKAVTDVFAGQPKQGAYTYLRDLGAQPTQGNMLGMIEAMQTGFEEGYANAPIALNSADLLRNIQGTQRHNQIQESLALCRDAGMGACQLDVEMETGTGKTYVYTKTMFELNRLYGWSKFIIVVPSIAIREGVYKSLQNTEQHFFEQYSKKIRYFIYNSDRLNELDAFSQSADICCMVINMQAFNSSMKEDGKSSAARIIFSERDEFGSRRPIDVIAANNPIVICDEPQKMGKKNSATQKGIARFNPLFILNYSATHKEQHDLVYVLDALDAYNQRLVKRIEVKGFKLKNMRGTDGYLYLKDIVVSANHAPQAIIEFKAMGKSGKIHKVTRRFGEGDDIYQMTGDTLLEAYKGYVIASGNDGIVPPQDGRPGYVRFLNGERIEIGEVYHDSAAEDMSRLQIRETIKSHLEKEETLFKRGIKCLSLFFIDEVAKYRDISGGGQTVGYGKIFEEEYATIVDERLRNPTTDDILDPSYAQYLARDDAHEVHDGYFSIDKKGNTVECKKETKKEREEGIGIGGDEAQRGYELILKDKERLLSFDEPVRFIFSHSALREGWDNPNIFQICTLKESGSETSKRQEVGRGMRLCVDQNGNRQDKHALPEAEVQRVNLLTVIASESYEDFAAALQRDIRSTLRDRPTKVEIDFFDGRDIVMDDIEVTFDNAQSKVLYKFLLREDLLDTDDRPNTRLRTMLEDGSFVEYAFVKLGDELGNGSSEAAVRAQIKAAGKLLQSVYDPTALDSMITQAREKTRSNKLNDNFASPEFQELWRRINRKHAYTVSFSDESLREAAIHNINTELVVSKLAYTVTRGAQKVKAAREDLSAGGSFAAGKSETLDLDIDPASNVVYDLVGEVAQAAAITRRSAAIILAGINPNTFGLFKQNPEEFIAKTARLIVEAKAQLIVDGISYRTIEDAYDETVFTEQMPQDMGRAYETQKNVQDYVFPDSAVERKFAEELDNATEVAVYAKLPRAFQIPTPVGNYAPDWAIAFNKGTVRHVFFIAETKGSMSELDLDGIENAKIACARKLFNEMSTSEVRYHQVSSYDDLRGWANALD